MSWKENISGLKMSQFMLFVAFFLTVEAIFIYSLATKGWDATIQFISEWRYIIFFISAVTISLIPTWNETHSRFWRTMRQGGWTFSILTIASLVLWIHGYFVTDATPVQQLIYDFAGRLWYITGIGVVITFGLGLRQEEAI